MITAQNIKIRLAKDEDFEQIFSIWLEGIYNSFEDDNIDLDTVKKKFSSNFFQREGIFNFWVAVDEEDKVLGWQSLIKCISHPVKENIYAESSTYISKNIRSDGLGKLLLDFVIQEAEKSSLEYIIGFVVLTNKAARRITSQTGWVEIGIMPPSKKGNNKFQKIFMIRPV